MDMRWAYAALLFLFGYSVCAVYALWMLFG